jgi:serine/threonine protein phosphatase PrpC
MSGDCSSDYNPKKIEENYNIFQKIKKIFEKSFSKTDKNLSAFCEFLNKNNIGNSQDEGEECIFDVEYSGSTCVSILLKEKNINKIYIANVGDSRAIIIKELQNQNRDWVPHQLSRDHKPTEEDEAQRILEYDGEIERIEDDDGNWTGPLRVWVKGSDGPGLAMTRSFGDEIGASVGVISMPEVTEYKVKEEDRAIIIASDGLWEYMENKDVTDCVKKLIDKNDPDLIVKELYKESIIRWKLKDQGIDDITIICVLLKND